MHSALKLSKIAVFNIWLVFFFGRGNDILQVARKIASYLKRLTIQIHLHLVGMARSILSFWVSRDMRRMCNFRLLFTL